MRRVLIICYYELKDYFLTIRSYFIDRYKWDVISYPLYMYCYDKNSKIENYQDHLSNYILTEKPDIILWWFTDVPLNLFDRIKKENPKKFFIAYAVNDPVCVNKVFLDKMKIFNMLITPSQHNISIYSAYCNIPIIEFFPMGCDDNLFKKYDDEVINGFDQSMKTDCSMVIDSLLIDQKEQLVSRKIIIQTAIDVCTKNGLTFSLYGPEFIKSEFPDVYRGDPQYIDMPFIFSMSKINIISNTYKNKRLTLNGNLIQIMSCGCIIMIDKVREMEMLNSEYECVFFYDSKNNLADLIPKIIKQYDENLQKINTMKMNCVKFSKKYTWNRFVDLIVKSYCLNNFDLEFYKQTYDLNIPDNMLILRWKEKFDQGIFENCYLIKVPTNFDHENYKERFQIKSENLAYLYIDWINRGKNQDYLKRESTHNQSINGETFNLSISGLFDLYHAFNLVQSTDWDTVIRGIDFIEKISDRNPRLQINECLRQYIDMISIM